MKKALHALVLFFLFIIYGLPATGQGSLSVQLYRAAREGRVEEIQLLLKRGANIEARFADGEIWPYVVDDIKRTPLIAAAVSGNIEVLQLLLKNGANIEPWMTTTTLR